MIVIEHAKSLHNYDVKLIQCETEYCVVYGAEINRFPRTGSIRALEDAIQEYNACVLHQMGTDGFFDDDILK